MSTEETVQPRKTSNSYNIFILVLTVLSLAIMAVQLLPLSAATKELLGYYDNIICFIFLYDFFSNLYAAPKKSDYFLRGGAGLTCLARSHPLEYRNYGGLLRLFRLAVLPHYPTDAR
jgi:hypothetical protein